jgi:hypothetical protein
MSDNATPEDIARWERLLRIPNTSGSELYDADNGIRQCILRAFGFHDEYLSYSSSVRTRGRKRLKGEGHNWASVSRVWRAVRSADNVRLINWTFTTFPNQERLREMHAEAAETAEPKSAYTTHARGVFIDKERRIFAVYEPLAYADEVSEWFGASLNDFAKRYKSYTRLLIYGNQIETSDCEKRSLRFGICCWVKFLASTRKLPRRSCSCGLKITQITTLYIRT